MSSDMYDMSMQHQHTCTCRRITMLCYMYTSCFLCVGWFLTYLLRENQVNTTFKGDLCYKGHFLLSQLKQPLRGHLTNCWVPLLSSILTLYQLMMHICVMSSHKPIIIYMRGLILGVNTLYRLFCFFKLFSMVGKGLREGSTVS